ncbi:MAG: phenylalanine--tRNA ligase subunit beta [Gammaproteobacteria bacterium]|nr:phenylalanine--tRNA ligase subunit beta [Gammaproteobacteria bacterium]
MRFSENWLRELIALPVDHDRLLEQFNLLGLEVDACEPAAPEFSGVLVAEIIELEKHPDADRLRVCKVDAGQGELLQIVCGASNAVAGMKAPLALVGAVLPGDIKINKGKLRGVESFGMLCSEAELGLAEKSAGLLALPGNAPVGTDIREYLDLNDHIIEIDLTPNRGDCLSMIGLARECAAANGLVLSPPTIKPVRASIKDTLPVKLEATQACPRYCGRVIRNIDPAAKTPWWMVEKLRRGGIRAIHPVVDITNFVMLELGQPMHGFDLRKLKGGIHVRMAEQGESLTLLDGVEIKLNAESLVIADQQQALALAGVMGGADSGVENDTCDIFFESAYFAPAVIMGRARQFGLHTDSSHRFERGVDPDLQRRAIERATGLLLEIAGGEAGPVIDIKEAAAIPVKPVVWLRAGEIKRLLGCNFAAKEVESILKSTGCTIKGGKGSWQVQPPSYRFDLNIEADMIEELARLRGYDRIPRRLPAFIPRHPQASEFRQSVERITSILLDNGYQEVVTYSFIDPALQRLIDPDAQPLQLRNPISADLSVMRSSLIGSLLNTLVYNINRQQKQLKLFETGSRYCPDGQDVIEERLLAGLCYGPRLAEGWQADAAAVDFYDIKGDVERLLAVGEGIGDIRYVSETHAALHPGQSARIYRGQQPIGWLGAIHPSIVKQLDLGTAAFVFELELCRLLSATPPVFSPISRFPSIRRDFSFEVDETVRWEEVQDCIQKVAPETLTEVRLFDVYSGKGVTPGRKSFAIGLILQEISRTLTDVEIESATSEILVALTENLGVTLRE